VIDEETTARLLRLGGMRAEVPTDREDRVRRAFLDECHAQGRARAARRRMATGAAVLSIAAAAILAVRFWMSHEVTPPVYSIVAIVERLEGSGGRTRGLRNSVPLVQIEPGHALRAGDPIETDATGRVSLRLSQGASLRFDHWSRARLVSASAVELGAGAVYVDSGPQSPESKSESTSGLEVHTSFGIVRDIGTQFEIRLSDASLRVRVRSGVVEVRSGGRGEDLSSAPPGTELTLGPAGVASRAVVPYGPDWAWAASLGPAFEMEGRPLDAFLQHLCREQGWTLTYADAKLARDASGMILHGSTAGLQPSDALAVALATTGLTHRLDHGELLIARVER
jgi:ferric-dicitrate binding protein FerR (iron transport regulator)